MAKIRNYKRRTARLNQILQGAGLKRVGRWSIFAAIITYLTFQLSRIGFADIASALPTSPVFYLLSIGFVAAPVCAELFAFKTITGRKVGSDWKLFLRKQVLNKAVMNFSGDAFLVQRLSKRKGLNLKRAAIILKDMTLIRAFSANVWIVILAIAAVVSGNFNVLQNITAESPALVTSVSLFVLTISGGMIFLFRKLTRLSSITALKVAAIYLIRAVILAVILISQWSLAVPGTAIGAWFIFLIIFSIAKKSPIGGELLFASIIVSVPGLGADDAAIAAMLIAVAGVTQIIYFFGFLLSLERKTKASPKPIKAPTFCSSNFAAGQYS